MKLVVTAIYSNWTTEIAEYSDMRQDDFFIGRPVGEKLVLRFMRVV